MSRVANSQNSEASGGSPGAVSAVGGSVNGMSDALESIEPYERVVDAKWIRAPLSLGQQSLWFVSQFAGANEAYVLSVVLKLTGVLNRDALHRALHCITQRHETLRTTFVSEGEMVWQRIAGESTFRLVEIDLRGYELPEREAWLKLDLKTQKRTPLDLTVGPLIRGKLWRLRDDTHVLGLAVHHIVSDDWSNGLLLSELSQLYGAFIEGRSDPLDALGIQYADYAQWQRARLSAGLFDGQLEYWRESLRGVSPLLELPTDKRRPPVQSYRGEDLKVVLDSHLTKLLTSFAERHEMTLFMVLYAGWVVLLSRISGQNDLVVGISSANRARPELESLIGYLVNPLPIRVQVNNATSLDDLLTQVKETMWNAYSNQDVPFESVVEALQPDRSLAFNPIFQVMCVLRNAPKDAYGLTGLIVEPIEELYDTAQVDLALLLEQRDNQISGVINFATDLFERSTIERWADCFITLLNDMTTCNVTRQVGDLRILSDSQRHQVLELFNVTSCPSDAERMVHILFEEQAARTPGAVAVVYEGRTLTYAELNRRANQLAHYLKEKGVGPDQLVGICVERSLEMVVGLLGVLKAGGAYVPLDPAYPIERLAYMLEDAAPQVLLTQERLQERIGDIKAEVIVLDSQCEHIARETQQNLQSGALRSHHLAYVIYTSGSTGKPKGVMIEHAGLLNYLHWAKQTYRPEEGDGTLVASSLAFDATITSLYLPLLCGRAVTLVRDGQEVLGVEALLREERTWSLIKISPAHLTALGQRWKREWVCRVGAFVIGGEALPPSTVQMWQELAPQTRLINEYGPTETVVGCSTYELPPQWPGDSAVPIGRPIANTRIYILDSNREPVPVGMVGDIYIGGAGVARGYWNRPELTADRFVRDPFSVDRRARMYKSGDLGRWRTDGVIEYFGRNDHQVKIRGFRIEPAEIEAQLVLHQAIREAVVISREVASGEKQLVAYLTHSQGPPAIAEIRAHLARTLPEHMIPAAYVFLERLPLTQNGKLDRLALPSVDTPAGRSRTYQAPQGHIEEALTSMWRELLKVERVGRGDNFFELGGHSLLVVRVLVRVRDSFGVELPVRALFDAPTIAELAAHIERVGGVQAAREDLLTSNLTDELRREISDMGDEEVAAEIARLNGQLRSGEA